MKTKHLKTIQTTAPGTVGSEPQNDRNNDNSETRAVGVNLNNEFPDEAALSEDSNQEAVTYDLWGTNHGKEANIASNSPKEWFSEKEDDLDNSDGEVSREEDSSADESDDAGYIPDRENESEHMQQNLACEPENDERDPDLSRKKKKKRKSRKSGKKETKVNRCPEYLPEHMAREFEKMEYLLATATDPEMIDRIKKFRKYFFFVARLHKPEPVESQPIECQDDTEIRKKLLEVKPLPNLFFFENTEAQSWSIKKKLEHIDKLIREEIDEDMKLRMQNKRERILFTLSNQLQEVDEKNKLTFNERIDKRMGSLGFLVGERSDDEEEEEEEKEEEEEDMKQILMEEESKKELLEEDRPLSEVLAEMVANAEEGKQRPPSPEVFIHESNKYVKPLASSVLVPPKDSDESEESEKGEYDDYDTSDEEDIRNTVGNIPMRWYDDYDHVGYAWDGSQIAKPPVKDELDKFLQKMEDRNFWRTVKDPQTGQDVVLCNEDVDVIQRLKNCKIPAATHEEYGPWIEWFTSEVMQTPARDFPESKKSFLPNKEEARIVSKMVYAIKRGWIKPKRSKPKKKAVYMLWEDDNTAEPMRRIHNHISAPKRSLPNHAESYNPPKEYLFDKKERREWKTKRPSERKLHFMPQMYESLREVPAYDKFVEERFRRCLDLYLCPRTRKMKLLIEPDDLLPKLPSPRDLQPFPTTQSLVYKGHTEMVRTISVEPKGQYLASGSDDLTVKLWEVATGRCVRTIPVGGIVRSVSWSPNEALSLLAVAADKKLLLINPCVGDTLVVKKTDVLLQEQPEQDVLVSDRLQNAIQWEQATGDDLKKGIRVIINHFKEIKQVTWHGRGDYFASVMPDAQNRSVIIHQVSKRRSQIPFSRSKGLVQCVLFHPVRPLFFVATQKFVRIYDLVKQVVLKKLFSNAKWISTMAIHPIGDNLLVGTYDRKVLWFDLDLSTKPYQTLRLHSGGVRGVAYHKNYPLFATSSDDNKIIVSHGMVYNDLLQNALIVPLKKLSFHEKVNDFSVFDIVFHPTQPWLFSTGADSTVRLYT